MAKPIDEIQVQIKKSKYSFSEHAIKRMIQRKIERDEVEEAILHGGIYTFNFLTPQKLL